MTSRHSIWLAALALAVLAGPASAACCYFSAKNADILQPAQKVFLTYDPAEKVETFTVQPKFEGNALDFGMVIPTPSQPKLHEMPKEFFKHLAVYTILKKRESPHSQLRESYAQAIDRIVLLQEKLTVVVLEAGVVGSLDYKIIKADRADDLFQWLKDNKYQYAGDEATLNHYVSKKWFFTVMKIDTMAMKKNKDGTFAGEVTPTRFQFSSDKFVYPLKITQITVKDKTEALFYVQAPHKVDLPGDWTYQYTWVPMLQAAQGCTPGGIQGGGEVLALTKIENETLPELLLLRDCDVIHTKGGLLRGSISNQMLKLETVTLGEICCKITEFYSLETVASEIIVKADAFRLPVGWQDTGIDLKKGEGFIIRARGQIEHPGSGGTLQLVTDPDGSSHALGKAHAAGSLLAKIGHSNDFFVAGKQYEGKAGETGRCSLRVAESERRLPIAYCASARGVRPFLPRFRLWQADLAVPAKSGSAGSPALHLAEVAQSGTGRCPVLGPGFHWILTSDRNSAYTWLATRQRQLCWAHLKRDFQGMVDRGNGGVANVLSHTKSGISGNFVTSKGGPGH